MRMLYVEGNEFAAECFVNLVCAHSRIKWQIHRVRDAHDAIDYLSGVVQFGDRSRFPLPHVVLLGLNSSTLDGLDLMAWIRRDGRFCRLPVLVTSTAATRLEGLSARELGLHAWFAPADDPVEIITLCEALGLNTLAALAGDLQKHCASGQSSAAGCKRNSVASVRPPRWNVRGSPVAHPAPMA